MTAITASDPRKASVVAAMKAKLGVNTRITMLNYDKTTETFSGHAPFIHQNISILASEVADLPVVEKVKLIANFTPAEIPAAIDAFLREKAITAAQAKRIYSHDLVASEYSSAYDYSSHYQLLSNCGSTTRCLANHLGLTNAQTLTMLKKMVENGTLIGRKGVWGFTVLPADTTYLASLTNTILTRPRLG
ncbi:MAG: hypothetical protein WCQ50_16220 [Spirochaetota bacterium]